MEQKSTTEDAFDGEETLSDYRIDPGPGADNSEALLAGIPWSIPSTLMSSSTSGQRIPEPLPMISNRERCSGVASESRHDHAKGTLIVRPSTN
jgi:hypothetical protein